VVFHLVGLNRFFTVCYFQGACNKLKFAEIIRCLNFYKYKYYTYDKLKSRIENKKLKDCITETIGITSASELPNLPKNGGLRTRPNLLNQKL
jgi:hypothetical protein